MKTEVMLFGILSDIIGENKIEIEGCLDSSSLRSALVSMYPKLGAYKFAMALNKNIVTDNTIINKGDIVALLPPFAGG